MEQLPYCAISPQSRVESTSGEILQAGSSSARSLSTGSANAPTANSASVSASQTATASADPNATISGTPTVSPSNGDVVSQDSGFFSVCQAGSDSPLCLLGQRTVGDVIAALLQFIFLIAVLLALGFLIYGGVKWITSGGDKGAVDSARSMLIAAIVGLVLVALSFVILNFALQFLTGGSFADLTIPTILPE